MELAIRFGQYIADLSQEQRDYNSIETLYKIFMTYERTKTITRRAAKVKRTAKY
jgi:hypothetical protein